MERLPGFLVDFGFEGEGFVGIVGAEWRRTKKLSWS